MIPRLHFIFRTSRSSSTSSSSEQPPPYELINTIVTPHPDARQLTIEINSSSASEVLFELTEYTQGDQYQHRPESTTILSTTSASRKRIREDPVSTALNKTVPTAAVLDTVAPAPPAGEGTTVAISKTTGRRKKKAATEGTSIPPKDGEPNNQVPKTTTKKQPAAQSSKPAINTSSPPLTATAATGAKVKAPTKKPTIALPNSAKVPEAKSTPKAKAKADRTASLTTIKTKQDGTKTLSNQSSATTNTATTTVSKANDMLKKNKTLNTPNLKDLSSPPTSKHTDDLFRGIRIAKNIKGTVVQGQVDAFNGTFYFCTFKNGVKKRLAEESFQEALYVNYL